MKKLLLTFATLLSVQSANLFACSPAPHIFYQLNNLQTIFASNEFSSAIQVARKDDFSVSIINISPDGGKVELSNGCRVESHLNWKISEHIGMCPTFEGVVSKAICQY